MRFPKATHVSLLVATAVTLTLLAPALSLSSAVAHQVEIVEDVGATLHIEPNDTPRAGEEILAWFALTRRGGQTIPLADCDCKLSIYSQPKGDTASLSPTLSAVDAEGYQDIPSARFTFPAVGAYSLVISGSPKQSADFTPFELDFDVTVAAGQSTQSSPAKSTEAEQENATDTTTSSLPVASPKAKKNREGFSRRIFTFVFIGLSLLFVMGTAISQAISKRKNK